jgi:hypothetical protein
MKKLDDLAPRALNLHEAAHYFGVSPGTFRLLIERGHAPAPIVIPGLDRKFWYREVLDRAMDALRDGVAARCL